jgi:hypothetical protein
VAKVGKFMYWTPRILSILSVLFIALFSLDVFEPGRSAGEIAIALLMHNIPTFVMLAIVIAAWKYELVGAIGFALLGLLYIALIVGNAVVGEFQWYMAAWAVQISGPLFIVGIFFFVNWKKKKLHNL